MSGAAEEIDDVSSRVRSIEERPLDQRATGYLELHETLTAALESGDAPHPG